MIHKLHRKLITSRVLCLLLVVFVMIGSLVSAARALAIPDLDFYSSNDILFYDPDCSASEPSLIPTGSASKSLEEFVDKYGQMAFDTGKKYGIPYEAILAQGALESGMGGSGLTQKANNFFGIKAGSKWTGETIILQTREETPSGGSVMVDAAFRKYPTPAEGWDGYGFFITTNPRYSGALKHPGDPVAYITAIKAAGYATDSQYVTKVSGIAASIASYIKTTNKWPPSSEVVKSSDNPPPVGTTPVTPGSCSVTVTGGDMSTVVKAALTYAWPNVGQHNGTSKSLAKPSYQSDQTGMPFYNNYANDHTTPWTDCGVFVGTVMRASGADPNYVGRGTSAQLSYVRNSGKFNAFIPKDTTELRPGDVMVTEGHTYIYTGPYKGDGGKDYSIAQASLGGHPPEAGNVYLTDTLNGVKRIYTAARVK